MDTKDICCMAVAVILVGVMSLVQPLLIGPVGAGGQDTGTRGMVWNATSPSPSETPALPTEAIPPETATPTPWDLTPVTIGFVSGTLIPTPGIPLENFPNRSMITYATIEGRWSGTTQTFSIPYPYWQLEYTAEPTALPPDVFPRLTIQVFDAGDPNRVVGIIEQEVYTTAPERPWVEKFYEGNRTYYFQVTTRFIKSYTINLQVPVAYV
jgi:hypothetical protein